VGFEGLLAEFGPVALPHLERRPVQALVLAEAE